MLGIETFVREFTYSPLIHEMASLAPKAKLA